MNTTDKATRRRPAGEAASPSVRMDESTYRRLRIAAVTIGRSVQALTTEAVEAHLDRIKNLTGDAES